MLLADDARRSGSSSFASFVKQAWPYVPQSDPLVWSWHMDALCDHMQEMSRGGIRKLLINIPPGHAKSIIVTVLFPAWVWTWWPKCQFLCGSYAATLATRDSLRCRDVIMSDWYVQNFSGPKRWTLSADQNTKNWFTNTKGGERFASGIGGTGRRAHIILIDDPLDARERFSEAVRRTTNDWIGATLSQRFVDGRQGRVCMIMQRLHEDDPSGFVLRGGGWEHLMLPSEFEERRRSVTHHFVAGRTDPVFYWQDPRTVEGEPLFPDRFPLRLLAEYKQTNQLGSDGFAGQHQQSPEPADGQRFKRGWWRFWKPDGMAPVGNAVRPRGCVDATGEKAVPAVTLPAQFDRIIISVDANFKRQSDADPVSILTIAELRGRRFLLARQNGPFGFTGSVQRIREARAEVVKAYKKRPHAIVIELAANGAAIVETLQEDFPEVVPVNPDGGKESRAYAVQAQIESGNFYLPEGAPWVDAYVHEFSVFPKGAHDDDVDATSQGLTYLSREGPDVLSSFTTAIDKGHVPGVTTKPPASPSPPRNPWTR